MSEICDVCGALPPYCDGRVECHLARSQARIAVLEDALREALEASSRGTLFGSDMERWSRVLRGEPPPAPEKP